MTTEPLAKKIKEPFEKKFKEILQTYLKEVSSIKVDGRLKADEQEIEKRKSRAEAQNKLLKSLTAEIFNTRTDIDSLERVIQRTMYPKRFSLLSSERLEAEYQEVKIMSLLGSSRTKEQLSFAFNSYLKAEQYDAIFTMFEFLQRSYQPIQPGQKERYAPEFIKDIEQKVSDLKMKLGIAEAEQEIQEAETYLNKLINFHESLNNEVDLLINGYDALRTETLELLYESYSPLYDTIKKNKYPSLHSPELV